MSTISVYTTTTNCIRDEYFIVEAIKSALTFADEVIVIDGYSSDNTIECIRNLRDSRIKIYINEWLTTIGNGMDAINRSLGIGRCTSDWCILMDADEVFNEYQAAEIKRLPNHVADDILAIKFNTLHFYRDYWHVLNGCTCWKDLYDNKIYMVRNGWGIHHGTINHEPDAHVMVDGSPISDERVIHAKIQVMHYGHVRTKETYVKKTNRMGSRYSGFDYKPVAEDSFEWLPNKELNRYVGLHPEVMKKRIEVGTDSYQKILELYQ